MTAASALYSIGNSLTNDLLPGIAVTALANDSGVSLFSGYHIRASQTLAYIYANPADVTLFDPFIWPSAVPSRRWDFLTMQPFTGSTLLAETAAFSAIAALANVNQLLIYEAWPQLSQFGASYQTYWAQAVPNNDSQVFICARQWFNYMYGRALAQFPGRVFVVPVGDVYNEIDIQARAGSLPGLATASDLYRDDLHANAVGRFVAASTLFATLYGRRSTVKADGLAYYDQGAGSATLTPALADTLEILIAAVVAADPRT